MTYLINMRNKIEPGDQFNRLTVISLSRKDKHGNLYWLCKCNCGNQVVVRAGNLRTNHTKSCGCFMKERSKEICIERNLKHGLSDTRLYNIWCNIKERCSNPNNPDYIKWYGQRGIDICEEWKDDFQTFYDWSINNGYRDDLTIDRIDNDGNYEPSNCRWVTMKEQCANRRKKVV